MATPETTATLDRTLRRLEALEETAERILAELPQMMEVLATRAKGRQRRDAAEELSNLLLGTKNQVENMREMISMTHLGSTETAESEIAPFRERMEVLLAKREARRRRLSEALEALSS